MNTPEQVSACCANCASYDAEPIVPGKPFCLARNLFVDGQDCCGCWVMGRLKE